MPKKVVKKSKPDPDALPYVLSAEERDAIAEIVSGALNAIMMVKTTPKSFSKEMIEGARNQEKILKRLGKRFPVRSR